MKGFVTDIEGLTEENGNFRHVLYTGKNLQLVLMSLKPGQDIGKETHKTMTNSSASRKARVKS